MIDTVHAVGIDLVTHARCERFLKYTSVQLSRIFHSVERAELAKRLAAGQHERAISFFASRFAVKEALFKALSSARLQGVSLQHVPFLTLAPRVFVSHHESGCPILSFDQDFFCTDVFCASSVSLAHDRCCSTAVVSLTFKI